MQTRPSVTIGGGRYELEDEIGRSGAGLVWRARDSLLRRTVAIELVNPALAADPAFRAALAERTRRLASAAPRGCARLLDTGDEDGVPFVVRELVEGPTLADRLRRDGPLPVRDAVSIALEVLEVLAEAHAAGIVNLSLDVEDVTLTPDGVRLTGPATRAGELGERADVSAAGALLFRMLTGEDPSGRTSARAVRTEVPRAIDRIVARALAEDPSADAASLTAALRAIATPENAPAPGVVRSWLVVPIVVLVLAAATISVGVWLGGLEVGGPLGIRAARDQPASSASASPTATAITPLTATVFDPPPGDGSENSSLAPFAVDGDRTTAWRSENYFDSVMHKPGVGLVLDLGEPARVLGLRLWTPHPGFVFHVAVGDDPQTLLDRIGDPVTAQAQTRVALDGTGRYVLVWVTTVVDAGDGNRAEISDVRVVVDD